MDEINELIRQCKDPTKKDILKQLKGLNKQAYKFMLQPYIPYKLKYRNLMKSKIWQQAKKCLFAYFLKDNKLFCGICKNYINGNFTLHHEVGFYHKEEIFSPSFCMLIHNYCHKEVHKK